MPGVQNLLIKQIGVNRPGVQNLLITNGSEQALCPKFANNK